MAERAGVAEGYEICSAGTSDWHVGEPPDARMRRVAAARGLVYTGQATQFGRKDFDRYDMIIAMDRSNYEDLRSMAPSTEARDNIRLLREFDPQGGPGKAVPDPYYGGIDGFEQVFTIIERSCRGLLEALRNGHVREE